MKNYIINEDITYNKFMLIDSNKENLGKKTFHEAMVLAKEEDLDLVLINDNPAVVKLIDYSKFKYEESKKNKKQHVQQTKEIQFSLKIADHDFNIKVNKAIKFLEKGIHVNFKVMLKGRENAHPELGVELLEKVLPLVVEKGSLAKSIDTKGRFITMVVHSNKKG